MYQVVTNLSHQAGAHALKVGADFLYNDDLITFPRAVRGTYAFSSMPAFLSGVYNNAGFTQTFGDTEVSQTNPNLGVYVQDEWKVSPRLTLNAGVRYELQFLETIAADADNVSPRLGVTWSPFDAGRTLVRGGAGLFFDRVPLRAVANALLSAGNTTDLTELRQIEREPVARAGRSPGVSEHPERLRAVGHAAQPDDDGPEPGERLFTTGQRGGGAAAGRAEHAERGVSVRRRAEPADVREPERPHVRALGDQQRLPPESDLRQQQPILVGRRVQLSRPARLLRSAPRAMGPLSNLVHAVDVEEQRRRVLLQFADRPARPLEGLGAFRRRSATPPRDARRRSLLDGRRPRTCGNGSATASS